jgi:hypothetical protein
MTTQELIEIPDTWWGKILLAIKRDRKEIWGVIVAVGMLLGYNLQGFDPTAWWPATSGEANCCETLEVRVKGLEGKIGGVESEQAESLKLLRDIQVRIK